MKHIALTLCLLLISLGSINAADPANASEQQLLVLIKEIEAQQALIVDNQAQIDGKLATVGEAVRVARIYSSRAGRSKDD